jgi:hypothetical protein
MPKGRLATVGLVLVLALGIGVGVGLFVPRLVGLRPALPGIWNTSSVLRQVQDLSQLVSVKYVVEKVVVLEDVKWYGDNRVILVAHGVVKAGVDLSRVKLNDLRTLSDKVVIRLPHPTITDVYLDEEKTRVVEWRTGLLRLFDKDLEQSARRQAIESISRAARASGILKDAEDRVRTQLRFMLTQMGFKEVEFELSPAWPGGEASD